MMAKEGSSKFVNFMTPGAVVLMSGHGHISHYSEYVVSSTLSIFSTLIAFLLRDYDTAILYQCKVSDTQMTIKACGPPVL